MRIFKRLSVSALAIGLSTVFAWVCAADIDLPEIGDSAGAIISPEQERKIGEAVLAQARTHASVIDDPEIEAYMQSLGSRLSLHVTDYEGNFNFFVIDDPRINAFAVPGGVIGTHSGLLLTSQSESEVAAVLAHEITHVTQRHIARSIEKASKMSLPMAAAMIGAIMIGATAGGEAGMAAMTAANAAQAQLQINATRANEFEADRLGIALLNNAGFDPHAMATFFERLQLANRYTDPAFIPEILRSHPVTGTRISEARSRAEKLPSMEYQESFTYDLAKAKLRSLVTDNPDRLVQEYRELLRSGHYKNEQAARYGYALALAKARDFAKARVQLAHLLQNDPEQVAYILALGSVEMAAGDLQAGLDQFAFAHELYPGYRPVVLLYAEALLFIGRPEIARELLRKYAVGRATQPRYYKLLAEAEESTGSMIESHIALAEYYFRLGQMRAAMQQLEIAKRGPEVDYYQRERIEARIEEISEFVEDSDDMNTRRRRKG